MADHEKVEKKEDEPQEKKGCATLTDGRVRYQEELRKLIRGEKWKKSRGLRRRRFLF